MGEFVVVAAIVAVVVYFVYVARAKRRAEEAEARSRRERLDRRDGDSGGSRYDAPNPREFSVSIAVEPARARSAVTSQSCWCPPGRDVAVAGRSIPNGMIYVGSGLASIHSSYVIEPALVDPSLAIGRSIANHSGQGMPYWPSYSDISPESRQAYLEWLSSGRSDPAAYIGYVFLFLYGLERRILHDFDADPGVAAELEAIAGEVVRLLGIYKSSASFQRYAGQLLDIVQIRSGGALEPDIARTLPTTGGRLPASLRVAVGRFAMHGQPLPVEWALAWVDCDDEIPKRTPVRRCTEEFERLFSDRYRARHGEGLALKPCKRQVNVDLQPASGSFQRTVSIEFPEPDVTALVGPRKALNELVVECTEALESLSRLRVKDSIEQTPLRVLSALPDELLASHAPTGVAAMRTLLAKLLDGRPVAVVKAADVIGSWLPDRNAKPTKSAVVEVVRGLQRLGFGMEPDPRFGGATIELEDCIALFNALPADPASPSAAYSAAALLLHLGACVAHTDGAVGNHEQQHLRDHLASALYLSEPERRRLSAYVDWLSATPPDTARLKKRIEALDEHQRRQAGQFVVGVALADGRIDPAEVKNLTKIFRLLELDPAGVHEAIHAAQVGTATGELARIEPSTPSAVDYAIPAAPGGRADRHSAVSRGLDMAAVEAKIRESAKVAALLGEILAPREEITSPPSAATAVPDANCVRSLDEKHSRLLRALGDRPSWTREEYERLAGEIGLMPDGALEVLGDLAFATCDAPLFDGDDPIELDMAVYEEILT